MATSATDYASKHCVPCKAGMPSLTSAEAEAALRSLAGWELRGGATQLFRAFRFKDFAAAMRFVNAMAELAEAEGHHPDFLVHGWNKVDVTLWTHDVGGLSENDFIVAARIDRLPVGP
ncbi:MAG: 4a-hydroxytetrahydrobiopterin dehydratase [Anaeromyxobacteraceae bacterium]